MIPIVKILRITTTLIINFWLLVFALFWNGNSINNRWSPHVVAKFAFESRYESEISMKGGDKIEIVEKDLDGY